MCKAKDVLWCPVYLSTYESNTKFHLEVNVTFLYLALNFQSFPWCSHFRGKWLKRHASSWSHRMLPQRPCLLSGRVISFANHCESFHSHQVPGRLALIKRHHFGLLHTRSLSSATCRCVPSDFVEGLHHLPSHGYLLLSLPHLISSLLFGYFISLPYSLSSSQIFIELLFFTRIWG